MSPILIKIIFFMKGYLSCKTLSKLVFLSEKQWRDKAVKSDAISLTIFGIRLAKVLLSDSIVIMINSKGLLERKL